MSNEQHTVREGKEGRTEVVVVCTHCVGGIHNETHYWDNSHPKHLKPPGHSAMCEMNIRNGRGLERIVLIGIKNLKKKKSQT